MNKTGHLNRVELNPFRGLQFFDESDAPFFFGRETVVEELFDRVTRQREINVRRW